MDIADIIEEKYTKYLNCEVDYLDLTIEEAKHILANDRKEHFVDDLLYEAYKVVLNELEKKDKVINEMAEMINNHDIEEDVCRQMGKNRHCNDFIVSERNCINCIKEYFTNKVTDINVGE